MCSFFVVPRSRYPLLGMPHIETLSILAINCHTIEMKEVDDPENRKTNTSQQSDVTEQYYTNTDSISKFKNEDKPMGTDNDNNSMKYFLPGPNSNNSKRVSA